MCFSPDQEISAADIVNQYSEGQLESIIRTYGEERQSRQIARSIIQKRPIATTVGLAEVVTDAVGGRHGRIHPATRTFQALRVAVNRELEQLESVLSQAISLLGFEGRLVVISYHSLEDRIVKRFMQRESRDCICPADIPVCVCSHQAKVKLISRRIIAPSTDEVRRNPRSRSARLRVAERVPERENSFADYLNVMAETDDSYVWKRPVMMEKVRRAFMALQVENIRIV
jgi:16S rRNA (cytosine1402-N4)-methyltransferase